ncbi:MAG: PHP domain-containing protein [Clostridia bacterium]|nr:PHP domain-containing protein [Clostridia bacterium]
MLLTADYHTHTPYSHGKNTVDENVARAKEVGLQKVAITDHGFSHVVLGLRRNELENYKAECKAAVLKYGIDVLVGIESNILGESGKTDLTEKDYEDFDVFLCGNHVFVNYESQAAWRRFFWFGNLPVSCGWKGSEALKKANTIAYLNAIKNNPIDILTHLGYLAPCDIIEVAKCATDYGTYIELNSKKTHFTDEELDKIVQLGARFVINSDAHDASRVGDTALVEEQLKRVRVPLDRIDNIDGRFPTFRLAELKKHL